VSQAAGTPKPILDTHIHLFQVTRPGGVPWPPKECARLYRDILPADYEAAARPLGIVGTGIVEASNVHADTRWVLDQVRGNDFFPFLVAQLEIGTPDFEAKLDEIAADPRVVGIRGFLWSPAMTLDGTQIAHLRALAARGMTLDLISRGAFNPKDKIDALAGAVPNLRIILDHLAGAKGTTPEAGWVADMKKLGQRANIHVKLSSLFDMFNPAADENHPWTSPTDLGAYRPHFDVVFDAFGAERILFGSNWPVCTLGGTLAGEIALVEEYLAPLGPEIRDAVMIANARGFYRRQVG
jgi:L-fuconolactonase